MLQPAAKGHRPALDYITLRVVILVAVQVCRIQKIEHFPDLILRHVIEPQKGAVQMDVAGYRNNGIHHRKILLYSRCGSRQPPHRFPIFLLIVYSRQLSHDDKAAPASGRTGGKGQHLVTGSHRNTGLNDRPARHFRKPCGIGPVILPAKPPGGNPLQNSGYKLLRISIESLQQYFRLLNHCKIVKKSLTKKL